MGLFFKIKKRWGREAHGGLGEINTLNQNLK
jgi:hypothetical protein